MQNYRFCLLVVIFVQFDCLEQLETYYLNYLLCVCAYGFLLNFLPFYYPALKVHLGIRNERKANGDCLSRAWAKNLINQKIWNDDDDDDDGTLFGNFLGTYCLPLFSLQIAWQWRWWLSTSSMTEFSPEWGRKMHTHTHPLTPFTIQLTPVDQFWLTSNERAITKSICS